MDLGSLGFSIFADTSSLNSARDSMGRFTSQAKQAAEATDTLTSALRIFAAASTVSMGAFNGVASRFIAFNALVGQVGPLAAGAVTGVVALGAAMVKMGEAMLDADRTMEEINAKLLTASGNSSQASLDFQFLADTSFKLGIDLKSSADAYGRFAIAAGQAGLTSKDTQAVFLGVATASSAMRMSADQTAGVLRTFENMLSRNRVTAVELQRQLSTSLPGAFQTAAEAMGMSQAQMTKAMKSGSIDAGEAVIAIGNSLMKFKDQSDQSSQGLIASENRLTTAFLEEWTALDKLLGLSDKVATFKNNMARQAVGSADFLNGLQSPSGNLDLDKMVTTMRAYADIKNKMRSPLDDDLKNTFEVNLRTMIEGLDSLISKESSDDTIEGAIMQLKQDRLKKQREDYALLLRDFINAPPPEQRQVIPKIDDKALASVQKIIDKMKDLQNVEYQLEATGKINFGDVSGYEKALEVLRKITDEKQRQLIFNDLNKQLPKNIQGKDFLDMLINVEKESARAQKSVKDYSKAQEDMPGTVKSMNQQIQEWKDLESQTAQGRIATKDFKFELAQTKEADAWTAKIQSMSKVLGTDWAQSMESALQEHQTFTKEIRGNDAFQQVMDNLQKLKDFEAALQDPRAAERQNRDAQQQKDAQFLAQTEEMLDRINMSEESRRATLEKISTLQQKIRDETSYLNTLWRQAIQTLTTSVFDQIANDFATAIVQGKSLGDVLYNLGQEVETMVLRMLIFNSLMSAFGPIGAGASAGGRGASVGYSGAAGGQLASGGPVSSGSTYLVGEHGPELFTPGSQGVITRNEDLGGSGNSGMTIHIDARGADVGVEARVYAAMSKLQASMRADVIAIGAQRHKRGYGA